MKLNNWSVVLASRGMYSPPTANLRGEVDYHPRLKHGGPIITSAPISVGIKMEGDECTTIVTTKSGSVYELGEPDPGYVAFLEENSQYGPYEALDRLVGVYPDVTVIN